MQGFGPAYNAKPAPIHTGDLDAAGFSTVALTSAGWGLLQGTGTSGSDVAAVRNGTPVAMGGLSSPLVAIGLLFGALWWLDFRANKRR